MVKSIRVFYRHGYVSTFRELMVSHALKLPGCHAEKKVDKRDASRGITNGFMIACDCDPPPPIFSHSVVSVAAVAGGLSLIVTHIVFSS